MDFESFHHYSYSLSSPNNLLIKKKHQCLNRSLPFRRSVLKSPNALRFRFCLDLFPLFMFKKNKTEAFPAVLSCSFSSFFNHHRRFRLVSVYVRKLLLEISPVRIQEPRGGLSKIMRLFTCLH